MSKLTGRVNPDCCQSCGHKTNEFGDDFCIDRLNPDIVMNACCGHGVDSVAYVQSWDGSVVRGEDAINIINRIKSMIET